MSSTSEEIAPLSPQQKLFILGEMDLQPNIFGMHQVQVAAGNKWLVYRDGERQRDKDLSPGRHTWWNGFFHKWRAQILNMRVELLPLKVKGRVKGPPTRDVAGATAVELACEVTAELEISCKLTDIENFLQYRDPLSVFFAALDNMVVEMIGQLPYDHYGQWATELRNKVRERLQGGRDDSERRLGIRVEDVFVTNFNPSTVNDRNVLAMYQMIERGKRELIEAQANAKRDSVVAQSFAEQGQTLNIAPSILALQNSPVGKTLIERDADLQKLMVASGLNPGVNVQPLQDSTAQLGSGQPASVGYLNPPRPALPGQLQPEQVSGQLYTADFFNQTASSTPSSTHTSGHPVDEARQNAEISALEQGGFIVAGKGQVVPLYDNAGQPIPGTKEWVLQVSIRRSAGYLMMVFHCPAGYPAFPPSVQMKPPTGGGLAWVEPNTVMDWHVGHRLVDVAQEIDENTP